MTQPPPIYYVGDRVYWDHPDDTGTVTKLNLQTGDITIHFDDGTDVVLDAESCEILAAVEKSR